MAKKNRAGKADSPRKARLRFGWPLAIVLAVAAVGVGYFAWQAADLPGAFVPSQGNAHLQSATDPHPPYNSDPPTSGPHLQYLAPWGIHSRPIPRELQVHNLEDGGVVIQYNCECPDLVAKLTALVKRYEDRVILAPYPGMKGKIALTAWQRIDTFEEFDEGRIVRFIKAFRGIDHHAK
ncbi:MAG: DUF3105 domain-containing protein [Candidatus Rokubacteria bacterium]|nr:DUF3105 domain-containing protein [Candidatus Rokubacteria bacterium]